MAVGDTPAPATSPAHESIQLSSWKAIAQHLNRDVRTVRRWEKLEGLPVHRHEHLARSSVYAFSTELDAWWENRHPGRHGSASAAATLDLPQPRFRQLRTWLIAGGALALALGASAVLDVPRRVFPARPVRIVLAVLPFEYLGRKPPDSEVSDILLDELISRLARSNPQALGVVARETSRAYAGRTGDIHAVSRRLHADYVLEGSVRPLEGRVMVAARLIHAGNQTVVWSSTYERDDAEAVRLPSEIARGVVDTLGLPQSGDRPRGGDVVHPEAYRAYVFGRYFLNRRAGQRVRARESFEQAIALEPRYAAAFAGLADAFSRLAIFGPLAPADGWARAEEAARRAIDLDSELAEAHVSLALVQLLHRFDGPAARRGLLRALSLDPANPDVHAAYALYLRSAGRAEEAVSERVKARDMNPLRLDLRLQLAAEYAFARHYARALAEYGAAQELEPHNPVSLDGLADTYGRLGRHEEAATATVRLLHFRQEHAAAEEYAALYGRDGFPAAQTWLERRRLEQYAQRPERNAWNVAFTYARLGDTRAALDWLERAYALRDPGVLQIRVDPDVDNLRAEPRFQKIVERIDLR